MPKQTVQQGKNWYVLHTYPGEEEAVARNLKQRIESLGMEDKIFNVIVPKEKKIKIKAGKRKVIEERIYPGYVFMEMEPTENGRVPEGAWFIIKETSGVGDFIGTEGMPTPMRDTDVAKMLLEAEKPEEAPSIKVEFKKGDMIKIREGAFENFEGTVDSIDSSRGIVKVIVTIFGRSTPLDIEYWQIEKL